MKHKYGDLVSVSPYVHIETKKHLKYLSLKYLKHLGLSESMDVTFYR